MMSFDGEPDLNLLDRVHEQAKILRDIEERAAAEVNDRSIAQSLDQQLRSFDLSDTRPETRSAQSATHRTILESLFH